MKIPKPGDGVRQLGIPIVVERLVQQAMVQVLEPILEPEFSASSYGFRPKRGAHDALRQSSRYVESNLEYVVDIDLEKFFDTVSRMSTQRGYAEQAGRYRGAEVARLKAGGEQAHALL